ncbi:MmcQ/YjbR family DNA-binding protein [Mycolicibacterium goodii]|uniref:MmcQ/YjbR family DNA-binding protein n=2 Tax=Mycolicibacterium goodii TaxID=134601 RepID=UPI00257D1A8F|nr:MmcQ/YjbR family DNA-binding protein [Mycolicibacterium goodii]
MDALPVPALPRHRRCATIATIQEYEMQHDSRLQARSATRADELPGAVRSRQDNGDWELWKVGGKVFMLHTSMPGEPVVILKADPHDAESLREAHTQITPGYHMNKKHWITLHPGDGIDAGLIDELVTESYLLVVEGLPKQRRPLDPQMFRTAALTSAMRHSARPLETSTQVGRKLCEPPTAGRPTGHEPEAPRR